MWTNHADRGKMVAPWAKRSLYGLAGDAEAPFSALQYERVVGNDNCVEFGTRHLQIPKTAWRYSFAKCRVTVYAHLDGTLSLG